MYANGQSVAGLVRIHYSIKAKDWVNGPSIDEVRQVAYGQLGRKIYAEIHNSPTGDPLVLDTEPNVLA
jgi:hypothetical protein